MVSPQAPRHAAPALGPWRIASRRFAAPLGAAALLLTGCSAGNYPSMQRWPTPQGEPQAAQQPSGQMAAPAPPPPEDPHLARGCDAQAADTLDAEFSAALPGVEAAVRDVGDAAPGSPGWSKGNMALASLQQIRARMGQVLAPAIEAYTADTIAHAQDDARDGGPARREAGATLAACQAHVSDLAAREDEAIDRLHGQLPD
ncbi:MAG: hypothetical protein KGJ57_09520 [Sphingomonadales bacterium]|nr:hypothetical protein [Sphingomonadales bacterium]MDE2169649.1 hypothetical protein [Sphingomonadales bacterium]